MFVFTLLFVGLLATSSGQPFEERDESAVDTVADSWKNRLVQVCDVYLLRRKLPTSLREFVCCKTKRSSTNKDEEDEDYLPYINIGVCPAEDVVAVIGKNKTVTAEESQSDPSATDDEPGIDEGECHVYKVGYKRMNNSGFIPGCLPGNMINSARVVQEKLGPGSCQLVGINRDCTRMNAEPLKPDHAYSYQIKLLNNPDTDAVMGMFDELPGCTLLDGGDMVKCDL